MPRWAISPQPGAALQKVDPEPVQTGDGATVQRFTTKNGKIFAKRIERTGLVKWFLQLEG